MATLPEAEVRICYTSSINRFRRCSKVGISVATFKHLLWGKKKYILELAFQECCPIKKFIYGNHQTMKLKNCYINRGFTRTTSQRHLYAQSLFEAGAIAEQTKFLP